MSKEEWMEWAIQGDPQALAQLCEAMEGLIRSCAIEITRLYGCIILRQDQQRSEYTKETIADLESVGMVTLLERIQSGEYDREKGTVTTYIKPFLDGEMRRYLERNIGALSVDRDSMARIRTTQRMYHAEGKSIREIAAVLELSDGEANQHLGYSTHACPVEDVDNGMETKINNSCADDRCSCSPEMVLLQKLCIEQLELCFCMLSKRDQEILGGCYGVFGYAETPVKELAIRNRMRESGVEKAKKAALRKLKSRFEEGGIYSRYLDARRRLREAVRDPERSSYQVVAFTRKPRRDEAESLRNCFLGQIRILIAVHRVFMETLEGDTHKENGLSHSVR